MVGDNSTSQRGQHRSTGNVATGERVENGERTADSRGSVEAESTTGGEAVHQPQPERKGLEQALDGEREADSTGMADDATREVLGASNRGDLRVFEEGLDAERRRNTDDSERTRRTAESERLVNLAKQHGLFVPAEVVANQATDNAEGREIEVNSISTVFERRNNANLPKNEEVIYSKEITPDQSSLLERPNFAQYPTEEELSDSKGTTISQTTNELVCKEIKNEQKTSI